MRHGNMERHTVTRRDPGMETCLFSSLWDDEAEAHRISRFIPFRFSHLREFVNCAVLSASAVSLHSL